MLKYVTKECVVKALRIAPGFILKAIAPLRRHAKYAI